jgi:D-cysteine desulfhydrase
MKFFMPDRIPIAQLPTPIQRLMRISAEYGGPQIHVKRDDLTGMALSGNKIRKLEFVLAKALQDGADVLITCGGLQSNHARAVAAAAPLFGMKAHLVLRGDPPKIPKGNLFLDRLLDAEITYVPEAESSDLDASMQQIADEYRQQGQTPYIIPMGASDATGALGYVAAIQELLCQFATMNSYPDVIVVPCGSAGTLAGLLIGKHIFELSCDILGISVSAEVAYFQEKVLNIVEEFCQKYREVRVDKDDIQVLDGYIGAGYGLSRPDELRFIAHVARSEGIILDPTYTGKAFYGLVQEIQKGRFTKGQDILFIHTGGIFGLLAKAAAFSREEVFT